MSTELPFSNNTIQVYAYEGFSYTISNPNPSLYTLQTVSNTTGFGPSPSPAYFTKNGNDSYTFAVSDLSNKLTAGTFETFVLQANGLTSSNTVNIGPGRFLDGSGVTLSNTSYTFFKNEPIQRIRVVAPSFTLQQPTSIPTLPPGLSFVNVASNIFDISGIPLVTVPTSNYQIIGVQSGGSKIVTTRINISVSNERVIVNLSGTPIVSNMQIGTPIATRVLTAVPPIGSTSVRYTYPQFPDGIVVSDISGNVQSSSSFTPTDPSYTMVISGTPTSNAAYTFRNLGATSNGLVYPVQVSRISPLPLVESTQALTFAFGETVLFDLSTIPTLYTGIPVDSSANFFRAATYFTSNVGMSNIFSPDLSDLSLIYIPSLSRANLSGTPLSAGTNSFTIRAINSNGTQRDYVTPITVSNDSVSFATPPTPSGLDVCYSFVLSRPLSQALTGYYPTPIQYQASAASGRPVTFSAPALVGTGLTLSNVSSNLVQLTGLPTSITSPSILTVTASAVGSPATASRSVNFSILNDVFTFGSISSSALALVQNKAMTPIQVSASTLSGRTIGSYAGVGLPAGLTISPAGIISGTPTASGSFPTTLTASTGFSSGSTMATFVVVADNIIVTLPNTTETVPVTFSNAEFQTLTYSGKEGTLSAIPISNRAPQQASNFTVSFSNGTFLQGDFSPLPGLLPQYRFAVSGTAGTLTTQATVNVAVTNPSTFTRHLVGLDSFTGVQLPNFQPPLGQVRIIRNTDVPVRLVDPTTPSNFAYTTQVLNTWIQTGADLSNEFTNVLFGFYDFAENSSAIVGVLSSNIIRSVDGGASWSLVPSSNIQSLDISGGPYITLPPPENPPFYAPANPIFGAIATDGTSNWVAVGQGSIGSTDVQVIRTSSNNGVTWADISTNAFTPLQPESKLYYNNGRYFLLTGIPGDNNPSNIAYYANASNLSNWTSISDFPDKTCINGFASDGVNTLLAVGSNGVFASSTSACFKSTDNGTSWTALPTSPIAYSGGVSAISNAHYAYGRWVVVGRNNTGFTGISFSTDLTTWAEEAGLGPGTIQVATEDGGAWQFGGKSPWYSGYWSNSNIVLEPGNPVGLNSNTKRFLARPVSTGTPSLTLSLPYDASDIQFVAPTTLPTILWQYVPISPLTIQAQTNTPGEFLYYYAAGLPDGLRFTTDDVSGSSAVLSGTSVRYSDAPQRVLIYAAGINTTKLNVLQLGLRTILPTVTRQQSGAGAYTSLVRQYTVVNAAQNSVNGKTLPATYPPLGEFTRPYPPDVVTTPFDPKCCGKAPS